MFFESRMEIVIDWNIFESEQEFYDSFLPQVSAPEWHGQNLDALGDSVVTGDVNGIEPPYTILSTNESSISESLKEFQAKVLAIFVEAKDAGRDIHVVKV
ncbi:MAG: hypothetical protein COA76_01610 [Moritella sp.]|nr:MAG: hypothetical protein COA76_01610 [Moritella sp.]